MCRYLSILLVVAAMAAFLGVMPASADIIIYQDTFGGSAGLSGTIPDVTLDQYGGTAGATWAAGTGWTEGSGIATIGTPESTAYLPFVPVAGNVYTLSLDVNTTATNGNWIAVGFSRADNWYSNAVGWMLSGIWGTTYAGAYLGPGQASAYPGVGIPSGIQTFSVILDTRPASTSDWTATWKVGTTTIVPTTAFGFDPAIQRVGMHGLVNAGSVDNFKLTVIPEPSTLALLATGLIGLLCYAWRKRK